MNNKTPIGGIWVVALPVVLSFIISYALYEVKQYSKRQQYTIEQQQLQHDIEKIQTDIDFVQKLATEIDLSNKDVKSMSSETSLSLKFLYERIKQIESRLKTLETNQYELAKKIEAVKAQLPKSN